MIRNCGIESIHKEALRLSQMLADGLRSSGYEIAESNGPKQATPIVNISPSNKSPLKSVDEMIKKLVENKISYARRGPGVRLATHAHNRDEDVLKALEILS